MTNPSHADWQDVRNAMPITKQWAYFDHAAVAPIPEPVRQKVRDWADSYADHGTTNWPRWRKLVETTRTLAANLINASTDEIAIVHSTTEGINLVAEGVPWKAGDNIVTLDCEFPSNLYPWLNLKDRGVEVRQVPTHNEQPDLQALANACDDRTRIVSTSWVGYATGWRNDLARIAEIAHAAGAKLFVDAIQGLSVFPLNVQEVPIDFLAADGHKWMLGPEGAGIFYVRKEHLDWLHTVGVGWNSVAHAGDFTNRELELKNSAGRYEGGTYNMVGIAGFAAALEFLSQFESETIANRMLEVTGNVIEAVKSAGGEIASDLRAEHRSGIVAMTWNDHDPMKLKNHLQDCGVVVNCRHGRLRVSPHIYTNQDDIDRLIAGLRSFGEE